MKNETNTKFIVRVMEQASTGPLMQAFVLEAVRRYSADILATETPADAETGFISWAAWHACAAEAGQALADRRT
jgi:hypothetical protein